MTQLLRPFFVPVVAMAALGSLSAQVPQLTPFTEVLDLLIVDTAVDGVWRKADRNQDGDFHDPGEITAYYDDTIGAVTLTNPTCIAVGDCGTAYVGDSTVDVILALDDIDGNGDALGAGEHRIFFDNSNASSVKMASVQGLTVDAIGRVFAAVSNSSSAGFDMVLLLQDGDGDGTANGVGEATVYCRIPNAVALGDSIPTDVRIAPDGKVYYTEVGATGVLTKGVYQLDDANGDGDCNDPGEWSLYWAPPVVGNAFYYGLAIDRTGVFYVTDHGNEEVWRGRDVNGDGRISGAAEENVFYRTANSTWWDVIVHPDGPVYLCEDQTPDRITVLEDQNGDLDALDPGESYDAYNETLAAVDTRPRAGAFLRGPTLTVQPGSVALGQTAGLATKTTRPGDIVGFVLSDQLAATPLPIPPFGVLELNPLVLFPVVSGTADAQCVFQFGLPVPNDPSLRGSVAFQAIAVSPFRAYFSNGAPLVIR